MTNDDDNFPTLDYGRNGDDRDESRIVLDDFGALEPYVDETDWWCRLPIRITHSCLAGVCLELGPYTLGERDVARLQAALANYNRINGHPRLRVVE